MRVLRKEVRVGLDKFEFRISSRVGDESENY